MPGRDRANSVLFDEVFRVTDKDGLTSLQTLPGLIAMFSEDRVSDLPGVRAHQAHTVHMFLAQLVSLLDPEFAKNGEKEWRDALLDLSDDPTTWQITPPMGECGFMQPAFPAGYKVPDARHSLSSIDVLVLSRNHAVKLERSFPAEDDAWLWQLITLQTGAHFPGKLNYGSFRMNGGLSSRSLWAVYDRSWGCGRWIFEDARLINETVKRSAASYGFATEGGIKLMWTVPWPEGEMLTPGDVDQRVLEVCRRVNLGRGEDGSLFARVGNSELPRTAMASTKSALFMKGACGDIWAPTIANKDGVKALSIDARGLTYEKIAKYATGRSSSDERIVPAPAVARTVDNPILIVSGIANGQGKTEGFFTREIIFEGAKTGSNPFFLPSMGETAEAMVLEAGKAQKCLRSAIKSYLGLPPKEKLNPSLEDRTIGALAREIDLVFFHHLEAIHGENPDARLEWISDLYRIGRLQLERAFEFVPVRRAKKLKRIAEAISKYRREFWSDGTAPSFAAWRQDVEERHKEGTSDRG